MGRRPRERGARLVHADRRDRLLDPEPAKRRNPRRNQRLTNDDRRPPLVVSADAGATWTETGGGLPPGFAVAVSPEDPDRVVYAARNRLYLSTDGGRFWRSLAPELPDIHAVAWAK